MASVSLREIYKKYAGGVIAVSDFNIEIKDKEFIILVGPSGCGKSTTLRMIAGLEEISEGELYIGDRLVNDIAPKDRDIAMVFQNYALYPHMTVFENMAFGLKLRKVPKDEIARKVEEAARILDIAHLLDRKPKALSGGQRQRIALARALAPNPEVLLLDEPFAAIDAKVRQELRTWLRETIDKIGITSIFVTHDQDEAIEVADEIIITNEGRVEQMGDPVEIYLHPKTPFVAQFIGKSSIIEEYGKLKGFDSIGPDTRAIIRPEFVEIKSPKDVTEQSSIYEQAAVEQSIFRGNYFEVLLNIKGITIRTNSPLVNGPLKSGDKVWVVINQMYVFDDKTTTTLTNKGLDVSSMYYI